MAIKCFSKVDKYLQKDISTLSSVLDPIVVVYLEIINAVLQD